MLPARKNKYGSINEPASCILLHIKDFYLYYIIAQTKILPGRSTITIRASFPSFCIITFLYHKVYLDFATLTNIQ